jgi:hypothetical protein
MLQSYLKAETSEIQRAQWIFAEQIQPIQKFSAFME